MKYVVLGGSGFIGSAIVSHISQQTECISISSSQCDFTDRNAVNEVLAQIVVDAVIVYAAGIPSAASDDSETFHHNVRMMENVFELLQRIKPKGMVFLSTVEIYGNPSDTIITEQSTIQPDSQYGVGKLVGELLFQRLFRHQGIPLSILRLPGIYGHGDKARGFIGALVRSIKQQKSFQLFNQGRDLRDYVYVNDVARAVYQLSQVNQSQLIVNLASGQSTSLAKIADIAKEVCGQGDIRLVNKTVGTHFDLQFDASQFQSALPEFAFTSIKQGLNSYCE